MLTLRTPFCPQTPPHHHFTYQNTPQHPDTPPSRHPWKETPSCTPKLPKWLFLGERVASPYADSHVAFLGEHFPLLTLSDNDKSGDGKWNPHNTTHPQPWHGRQNSGRRNAGTTGEDEGGLKRGMKIRAELGCPGKAARRKESPKEGRLRDLEPGGAAQGNARQGSLPVQATVGRLDQARE